MLWRGKWWCRVLGRDVSWCQTQLREAQRMDQELRNIQTPLVKTNLSSKGWRGHSATPRSWGGDTNPGIVQAMDFCHGAQSCRANRSAAAALLTPTASWGYTFSLFSYFRGSYLTTGACMVTQHLQQPKWHEMVPAASGITRYLFPNQSIIVCFSTFYSQATHNFLRLCLPGTVCCKWFIVILSIGNLPWL